MSYARPSLFGLLAFLAQVHPAEVGLAPAAYLLADLLLLLERHLINTPRSSFARLAPSSNGVDGTPDTI